MLRLKGEAVGKGETRRGQSDLGLRRRGQTDSRLVVEEELGTITIGGDHERLTECWTRREHDENEKKQSAREGTDGLS